MGEGIEGGQNAQTSSYEISSRDVMYDKIYIINTDVWYMWKLLKVNPKNSHHKEKVFFSFVNFVPNMKWWIFTKLTMVIILYGNILENPIIMLCTLNLCNAICQFYLSNTRRKNKNPKNKSNSQDNHM